MTKQEADRVKAFLRQAYYLDRAGKLILEELDALRKDVSRCGDPVPRELEMRLDAAEARQLATMVKFIDKYKEISDVILSLRPSLVREVLERRYLLFQPWEEQTDRKTGQPVSGIAEQMGYSRERILQLHRAGLERIARAHPELTK